MGLTSHSLTLVGTGVLLLWLGSGCAEETPSTYRVPKEQPAPAMPGMMQATAPSDSGQAPASAPQQSMTVLPGMAEQSAAFGTPTWTVPAGWQAQALGQMRKGSWLVKDAHGTADISVLPLGGGGGGALANINRWCGQIGLAPMAQAQLDAMITQHPIETANAAGYTVSLHGPKGQSIQAAIVPVAGSTWFFKMMGPTATVDAQAAAFNDFVRSTRFPE